MALSHRHSRRGISFSRKRTFQAFKPSRHGTSRRRSRGAADQHRNFLPSLPESESVLLFLDSSANAAAAHAHTDTDGALFLVSWPSARTPPNHARPSRPNTAGDGRCSSGAHTLFPKRGPSISAHTLTTSFSYVIVVDTLICCREGGSIKKHTHTATRT